MRDDRIFRVGDKMVSLNKATRLLEKVLELREKGVSQQEAAKRLHLDRSFVSRLEAAGEVRKGSRVAVIGFPLQNNSQLSGLCQDYGLDFYLLLNNQERWDMVKNEQALDFFNRIFDLVAQLREYDTLIIISSERWYRLAEALLDIQVICIDLGPTPIREDRYLDPQLLKSSLEIVLEKQPKENRDNETHRRN